MAREGRRRGYARFKATHNSEDQKNQSENFHRLSLAMLRENSILVEPIC
jgi:hypothetical protein